jgi:5-methylcytosine-specific restriction endonuclease McrA
MRALPGATTKICSHCRVELSLDRFYSNRSRPDGLTSCCRDCSREATKRYYEAHKEEAAQHWSDYYEQNREYLAAQALARYWEHRDEICEKTNARRADPQVKAKQAAYNKTHRANRNANTAARRARLLNGEGRHTVRDVQAQYELQEGRCFYCSTELNDGFHVDHYIPLSRGGSNGPENIVIACPPCNLKKGSKHPFDFMQDGLAKVS